MKKNNERQTLDTEVCRMLVEIKLNLPWFIKPTNNESKKNSKERAKILEKSVQC